MAPEKSKLMGILTKSQTTSKVGVRVRSKMRTLIVGKGTKKWWRVEGWRDKFSEEWEMDGEKKK